LNARMLIPTRAVLSLALLAICAAPVLAQEPQTQPREHVVRRGDTLWDLARSYFQNPFLWPRIFDANRQVIRDPHWIYPDQRFVIPGLADTLAVALVDRPGVPVAEQPGPGPEQRTRFYRRPPPPDTVEVTVLRIERETPYAVTPYEYLGAAWLADTAMLGRVGRVDGLADPARVEGRLPSRLHPHDRVVVGHLTAAPAKGDTLVVVNIGRAIAGHGRVVRPVALLRVDDVAAEVLLATVVHQFDETRVGDLVLVHEGAPALPRGAPRPVDDGAAGRLLGFVFMEPLHGTTDLAFVDLGAAHGVGVGDELVGYAPAVRRAGQLAPQEAVGRFRVVRVGEHHATVRVVSAASAALARAADVRIDRQMQ
jgi:hypothetical protein